MIKPEQVQYFFQNTEDAVCIVSASGDLQYANPAAERLFGIPADSGMKIWKAVPFIEGNDDLIQLFIDAVTNKVATHEALADYWNNDGEVKNLHVRMTCYKGEETAYLIVITDLTQLIKVNSALVRYTSQDIADFVLTTEEGQRSGGKNKEVTVIMSDLRGFTALSAQLTAEQLITVINHYFEAMSSVVQKYGGSIIEFLGDGIFIIFGAPKDLPDHPAMAVKCAVEMQNAMAEVNEWNIQNGFPVLEMGIGINTGVVVVGNIGSEKAMKYGCMGSAVNITGRLESLTIGGQIFITENTAKLINEELSIVSEGCFLPKGSPEELKYYEIKGVGDLETNASALSSIKWREQTVDIEYQYYVLEAKKVGVTSYSGKIVRYSEDRKFARFISETALEEKQNIMLRKDEECIYAKVIRKDEEGLVICFTSMSQVVAT